MSVAQQPAYRDGAKTKRQYPPGCGRRRESASRIRTAGQGQDDRIRAPHRAADRRLAWQRDGETGALPQPAALGAHGSAVGLDQRAHDRQAEAEPAVESVSMSCPPARTARRPVPGRAARSRGHCPSPQIETVDRSAPIRTCTRPPSGVNFIAFDSRFDMICWRRSASPSMASAWSAPDSSTEIRRPPPSADRLDRGSDDAGHGDGRGLHHRLPGREP